MLTAVRCSTAGCTLW